MGIVIASFLIPTLVYVVFSWFYLSKERTQEHYMLQMSTLSFYYKEVENNLFYAKISELSTLVTIRDELYRIYKLVDLSSEVLSDRNSRIQDPDAGTTTIYRSSMVQNVQDIVISHNADLAEQEGISYPVENFEKPPFVDKNLKPNIPQARKGDIARMPLPNEEKSKTLTGQEDRFVPKSGYRSNYESRPRSNHYEVEAPVPSDYEIRDPKDNALRDNGRPYNKVGNNDYMDEVSKYAATPYNSARRVFERAAENGARKTALHAASNNNSTLNPSGYFDSTPDANSLLDDHVDPNKLGQDRRMYSHRDATVTVKPSNTPNIGPDPVLVDATFPPKGGALGLSRTESYANVSAQDVPFLDSFLNKFDAGIADIDTEAYINDGHKQRKDIDDYDARNNIAPDNNAQESTSQSANGDKVDGLYGISNNNASNEFEEDGMPEAPRYVVAEPQEETIANSRITTPSDREVRALADDYVALMNRSSSLSYVEDPVHALSFDYIADEKGVLDIEEYAQYKNSHTRRLEDSKTPAALHDYSNDPNRRNPPHGDEHSATSIHTNVKPAMAAKESNAANASKANEAQGVNADSANGDSVANSVNAAAANGDIVVNGADAAHGDDSIASAIDDDNVFEETQALADHIYKDRTSHQAAIGMVDHNRIVRRPQTNPSHIDTHDAIVHGANNPAVNNGDIIMPTHERHTMDADADEIIISAATSSHDKDSFIQDKNADNEVVHAEASGAALSGNVIVPANYEELLADQRQNFAGATGTDGPSLPNNEPLILARPSSNVSYSSSLSGQALSPAKSLQLITKEQDYAMRQAESKARAAAEDLHIKRSRIAGISLSSPLASDDDYRQDHVITRQQNNNKLKSVKVATVDTSYTSRANGDDIEEYSILNRKPVEYFTRPEPMHYVAANSAYDVSFLDNYDSHFDLTSSQSSEALKSIVSNEGSFAQSQALLALREKQKEREARAATNYNPIFAGPVASFRSMGIRPDFGFDSNDLPKRHPDVPYSKPKTLNHKSIVEKAPSIPESQARKKAEPIRFQHNVRAFDVAAKRVNQRVESKMRKEGIINDSVPESQNGISAIANATDFKQTPSANIINDDVITSPTIEDANGLFADSNNNKTIQPSFDPTSSALNYATKGNLDPSIAKVDESFFIKHKMPKEMKAPAMGSALGAISVSGSPEAENMNASIKDNAPAPKAMTAGAVATAATATGSGSDTGEAETKLNDVAAQAIAEGDGGKAAQDGTAESIVADGLLTAHNTFEDLKNLKATDYNSSVSTMFVNINKANKEKADSGAQVQNTQKNSTYEQSAFHAKRAFEHNMALLKHQIQQIQKQGLIVFSVNIKDPSKDIYIDPNLRYLLNSLRTSNQSLRYYIYDSNIPLQGAFFILRNSNDAYYKQLQEEGKELPRRYAGTDLYIDHNGTLNTHTHDEAGETSSKVAIESPLGFANPISANNTTAAAAGVNILNFAKHAAGDTNADYALEDEDSHIITGNKLKANLEKERAAREAAEAAAAASAAAETAHAYDLTHPENVAATNVIKADAKGNIEASNAKAANANAAVNATLAANAKTTDSAKAAGAKAAANANEAANADDVAKTEDLINLSEETRPIVRTIKTPPGAVANAQYAKDTTLYLTDEGNYFAKTASTALRSDDTSPKTFNDYTHNGTTDLSSQEGQALIQKQLTKSNGQNKYLREASLFESVVHEDGQYYLGLITRLSFAPDQIFVAITSISKPKEQDEGLKHLIAKSFDDLVRGAALTTPLSVTLIDRYFNPLAGDLSKVEVTRLVSGGVLEAARTDGSFQAYNRRWGNYVTVGYFEPYDWYIVINSDERYITADIINYLLIIAMMGIILAVVGTKLISLAVKRDVDDMRTITNKLKLMSSLIQDPISLSRISEGLPMRNDEIGRMASFVRIMSKTVYQSIQEALQSRNSHYINQGARQVMSKLQNTNKQEAFINEYYRQRVFAHTARAEDHRGDFFDVIELANNKVAVVIGSTNASGVVGASTATINISLFRQIIRLTESIKLPLPKGIMEINQNIVENNADDIFTAVCILIIDERNGRVEYLNAGHTLPIMYHRKSGFEYLDIRNGPLLGAKSHQTFNSISFNLKEGDSIFLYTDGLLELKNHRGETLGQEGLESLLHDETFNNATTTVNNIENKVKRFIKDEPISRDYTVLCYNYKSLEDDRS